MSGYSLPHVSDNDRVRKLWVQVSEVLEEIRSSFVTPDKFRLTLVVRHPDYPDGSRDVLVSDDTEEELLAAIRKLHQRPEEKL